MYTHNVEIICNMNISERHFCNRKNTCMQLKILTVTSKGMPKAKK